MVKRVLGFFRAPNHSFFDLLFSGLLGYCVGFFGFDWEFFLLGFLAGCVLTFFYCLLCALFSLRDSSAAADEHK